MAEAFSFRYQLSAMAKERLDPSEIGVMIKLCIENQAISLTAGEPSADIYPIEELKKAFTTIFEEPSLLAYSKEDFGLAELREWITARMKADGMSPDWVGRKNILLTNGAGEAIELVAETLIDPGCTVLVEAPTFTETLLTFRKQGANCVGVPSDDDGIIPEEFERLLKSRAVRFLYTIPNFQNPSGRTSPLERRREILAIAAKYDIPIFEDDPYHYLSYDGEPPATYLSLAGDDRRVLHSNSFSKLVAPGMRCGWLVVPDAIIAHLNAFRISAGLTRPAILQLGLFNYLNATDFGKRVKFLRDTYRTRRDAMVRSIEKRLKPLGIKSNYPKGGFFLWGEAPEIEDMTAFARFAVEKKKVGVIPGSAFYTMDEAKNGRSAFRLSFAKVAPADAEEGIKRLAEAFMEYR
ncbi:MAG: PLP-dependent aminotransferase family protein [Synergistaceae bacterium]|nr:PLP-dependent aminotransferase family protein [Synergistaceae bacterium]